MTKLNQSSLKASSEDMLDTGRLHERILGLKKGELEEDVFSETYGITKNMVKYSAKIPPTEFQLVFGSGLAHSSCYLVTS